MALALSHTYRYYRQSSVGSDGLALVTALDHPAKRFFKGHLLRPQCVSELLLGLSNVVRSRFFVPPAMLGRILLEADPVITCEDSGLRFEGFSSCCSCYARLDLDSPSLDGQLYDRGTTNVEFGASMRAALAGMRALDTVRLSIGMEGFEVSSSAQDVIERKVELPIRWVKGFCETGIYLSRMQLWLEVTLERSGAS